MVSTFLLVKYVVTCENCFPVGIEKKKHFYEHNFRGKNCK